MAITILPDKQKVSIDGSGFYYEDDGDDFDFFQPFKKRL